MENNYVKLTRELITDSFFRSLIADSEQIEDNGEHWVISGIAGLAELSIKLERECLADRYGKPCFSLHQISSDDTIVRSLCAPGEVQVFALTGNFYAKEDDHKPDVFSLSEPVLGSDLMLLCLWEPGCAPFNTGVDCESFGQAYNASAWYRSEPNDLCSAGIDIWILHISEATTKNIALQAHCDWRAKAVVETIEAARLNATTKTYKQVVDTEIKRWMQKLSTCEQLDSKLSIREYPDDPHHFELVITNAQGPAYVETLTYDEAGLTNLINLISTIEGRCNGYLPHS